MTEMEKDEVIAKIADEVDIIILNDGEYTPRGSYLIAREIAKRLYELGYRLQQK